MLTLLARKPSAFVPLLMSLAALLLVATALATHHAPEPTVPPHDEGAYAHTWQLLMSLQFPVILYFAARWLPTNPKSGMFVLALQLGAGLAAAFPVFYLGL